VQHRYEIDVPVRVGRYDFGMPALLPAFDRLVDATAWVLVCVIAALLLTIWFTLLLQ